MWVQRRIGAQPYMPCREEVGVSFIALEILEKRRAHNRLRSSAISRHLTSALGRSLLRMPSSEFGPTSFVGTLEVEDC
jgi:hypothetical protein